MKLTRFVTDFLPDVKLINNSVQSFADTDKRLLILLIIIIIVCAILYSFAFMEKKYVCVCKGVYACM